MPSKKAAPPLFGVRTRIAPGTARALSAGSVVVFLATWFLTTLGDSPLIDRLKLPPPHEVLRALIHLLFTDLGPELGVSALRVSIAFILCIAVSLPLGVAMGAFESINRWVDPIISPLRFTPMNAFVPIFIMWFGIDETEKIAFLFFATVVFLLPVVVDAIRAVPEELVQTAQTLGASRWQLVRTVLLPAALPQIFDNFRVMNGIAWGYILLAEMVNSRRGLGHLFDAAWRASKADQILALILVVGIVGLVSDLAIRTVNGILFRWRESDA
ncbi:MAG: ABC transporter permease [Archangiaceae bacterium]|nr:ABC transporter permease [Archangiaceae bacterium]